MTDQPGPEPTVDLPPTSDPLDAGLAAAFGPDGGPSTSPPLAEGPGSRIGAYKLLQQIGEGGMGVVFMAEQTEPVCRLVALKVIKQGMDTHQVIARFEAERQALALMDHPNIAKVLGAGATEAGRPYFVMELVKGVPITKYCDEHRLTPRQRLELFIPVCQAVQHAHQKGIIHRDLKPSNVLIASYDGKPVPKVIDFGVAKATGQKLTDKTLFTDFGAVVGTLEYMSPEQAELNQLDIDTRSDVYALGVLLYVLLTGTTPLEGKRLRQAAILECLRIIREEEPPKPSTRLSTAETPASVAANRSLEPKKLSALVCGDLDWIVMKCLEKDRNRRYETANGLALDVHRYLADETVLASPPSPLYRLHKFGRRHKAGLLTTAAVLVVVLLAGNCVGWVLWDQATQAEARRMELAGRMADTEKAVTVALAKVEQSMVRARRQHGTTSMEAEVALVDWKEAAAALSEAEAALTTGAPTDGLRERVAAMREQVQSGQTLAARNGQLFRDLDEARLARSVWVHNDFDFAGSSTKYAAAFAAYGLDVTTVEQGKLARRLRAADPEAREALFVALLDWAFTAAKAGNPSLSTDLRTLSREADVDSWRQRFLAATTREALRELAAEARRSPGPPSLLVLLAGSLESLGQPEDALAVLRFGRSRHPTDFWLYYELGQRLLGAAVRGSVELEEAIGCFRAALALRPEASLVHSELAFALRENNQLAEEVIAELRRAIELGLGSHEAGAHNDLGRALQAANQLDDAIAEFEKAIALDRHLVAAHYYLGEVLLQKGRFAEAKMSTQRALKLITDMKLADKLADFMGIGVAAQQQITELLQQCEALLALEPKLPDVLAGKTQPADNRERLGLIDVCRYLHRYAGAAKLYSDAVAADPNLDTDLNGAYRYNAACTAALAAAGEGTDASKLDDKERIRLRKQALDWLRADLDLWTKRLADAKPPDRQTLLKTLKHWQEDTDLIGVRDAKALEKLPADEREACQKLWADVAELLKKAGDAK